MTSEEIREHLERGYGLVKHAGSLVPARIYQDPGQWEPSSANNVLGPNGTRIPRALLYKAKLEWRDQIFHYVACTQDGEIMEFEFSRQSRSSLKLPPLGGLIPGPSGQFIERVCRKYGIYTRRPPNWHTRTGLIQLVSEGPCGKRLIDFGSTPLAGISQHGPFEGECTRDRSFDEYTALIRAGVQHVTSMGYGAPEGAELDHLRRRATEEDINSLVEKNKGKKILYEQLFLGLGLKSGQIHNVFYGPFFHPSDRIRLSYDLFRLDLNLYSRQYRTEKDIKITMTNILKDMKEWNIPGYVCCGSKYGARRTIERLARSVGMKPGGWAPSSTSGYCFMLLTP